MSTLEMSVMFENKNIIHLMLVCLYVTFTSQGSLNSIKKKMNNGYITLLQHKKKSIFGFSFLLLYLLIQQKGEGDAKVKMFNFFFSKDKGIINTENLYELVFYFHGWGLNKEFIECHIKTSAQKALLKKEISQKWHSPLFNELTSKRKYRKFRSSFGQKDDVFLMLAWISTLFEDDKNISKINFFSYSRGAQVAANCLGVLCTPDHPLLQDAEINEQQRKNILEKLRKGKILLHVPLISVSDVLHEKFSRFFGTIINYCVLPIITCFHYNPFGMTAIKTLQNATEKGNFDIDVVFANNDLSVGTNEGARSRFIDTLKTFNGDYSKVNRHDIQGHHMLCREKTLHDIFFKK